MQEQDYRQEFQQMLLSTIIPEGTKQDVIREKISILVSFINEHIPPQLFRYRNCSEDNIDAFDNDTIYAVSPTLFNDPYDALFRYDRETIIRAFEMGLGLDTGKALLHHIADTDTVPESFVYIYGKKHSDELKKQVRDNKNNLDEYVESLFNNFQPHKAEFLSGVESLLEESCRIIKQGATVACFSEKVDSVLMWSHYANYHKGFVLEYDLRNFEMKCGHCEKRNSCQIMTLGNIYPVLYSDKRYDATHHAIAFATEVQAKNNDGGHFPLPDIMVSLKAFLHKSSLWEYEKEWRLILNRVGCDYSKPIDIMQKPTGIYYGSNISSINRKILHSLAKTKGLQEYQMYIDESSLDYKMKFKQCTE